jgi:trafficking protein particle complex subunit 10
MAMWMTLPFIYLFIYKNVQDLDEFKTILKPRLKLIVQNDEREWFIVFVSKAHPSNDQATKMAKKVYARLEADFNTKKRERYLLQLLHGSIGLEKNACVKFSNCSNPAFHLLLFCSYVFFH